MREGAPSSGADAKLQELCQTIESLIPLLESAAETHWANWLRTDLQRLRSGDTYALHHLLQSFGGMGSFNDLVIHQLNGHTVEQNDVGQINDRLGDLRSDIYRLAHELERIVDER